MNKTMSSIAAVALLCSPGAKGGDELPQKERNLASMVASSERSIRQEAIQEVMKGRQETILALSEIVHRRNASKYSGESRATAAYILGEIRASEAVSALSSALGEDLFGSRIIKDLPPPYESSDVVINALVNIGLPSVAEMTRNLRTTDSKRVMQESVVVLKRVLGGDKRAQELVDTLLEEEKDAAVRERLLQAKRMIGMSK